MKKLLLSTAAIALISGSAMAADLPSFEPAPIVAPVADVFSWTGFYAGAAVGYGWGQFEADAFDLDDDDDDDETADGDGWLFGAFAGYNFEVSGFVAGVEADLEWTGIDTDDDDDDDDDDILDDDDDDDDDEFDADVGVQGSVRGRLGFAADRALFYGTFGLAAADIDCNGCDGDDDDDIDLLDDDDDDDDDDGGLEFGWTLGAGVDFAVTDNVFVRGEYRYTDYADFDNDDDEGSVQDLDLHTVRLGAGFLF